MIIKEVILLGLISVSVPVFILLVAGWYVIEAIAYTKLFPKTGRKASHAWIPVVNYIERFDIAWQKSVGAVSLIAGMVSMILITYVMNAGRPASMNGILVVGYILMLIYILTVILGFYKLTIVFEHGPFFALGLIFFAPIFLLILGFGKSVFWGEIK